ncbi:MAG TPA: hypothetical protein VE404_08720 [Verrucomicrobiae bacterium]|nr:hypothetical protein [Verrucomicrobiae bacterium]
MAVNRFEFGSTLKAWFPDGLFRAVIEPKMAALAAPVRELRLPVLPSEA